MKAAEEAEEAEKKAAQEAQERRAEYMRLAPISPQNSPTAPHRSIVNDCAFDQVKARKETTPHLMRIVNLQAQLGGLETELREAKYAQQKAGKLQEAQRKAETCVIVPGISRALSFAPVNENASKRGKRLQNTAVEVSGYRRGELQIQRHTRRMRCRGPHITQMNPDAKKPGFVEPPYGFQINTTVVP